MVTFKMKDSEQGSLTLSFDCEGKWGMSDITTEWNKKLTDEKLIKAYDYILEVLEEYNLKATFGIVGAFTETKKEFFQNSLSQFKGSNHLDWINCSIKKIEEDPEGWFLPEILEMIKRTSEHEICSHSYSHVPMNTLDAREALDELLLVENWKERNNLECSSFIFPRNLIAHPQLLSKFKIEKHRDKPNMISNSLIEELNIFKKGEYKRTKSNQTVPGGIFINWQYGFRKYIPNKLTLMRYKSIINDSKRNNKVAHFWVHPHNFITASKTKTVFEDLCKLSSKAIKAGDLKVNLMKDL